MKKILAVIVIVCLLSTLICACGNTAPVSGKTPTSSISVSESDMPSETEELWESETAAGSAGSGTEQAAGVPSDYEITRDVYWTVRDKLGSSICEYSDFEIDAGGNVISARVTGGNTHTMTYEYDDNGRLVKSTKENKLYGTEEQNWIYDDKGRMIELRLVETKKGSSEERKTTYIYDDDGILIAGQRDSRGGKTFDKAYESDDMGRITKCTETENGEFFYSYTYTYSDGVYNPTHITEDSGKKTYETDVFYDDRGRIVKQDTRNSEGGTNEFVFTYDVIGEVTESAETTSELIPGDQWEYFEDCKMLPVPGSCLAGANEGETDHQFILPTGKGIFFSAYGQPYYEPWGLDSSFAYTALDRYVNILTDVLGLEVRWMGTLIKVSQDGNAVADLSMEIIDGKYTLTVIPVS